MEWNNLHKQTPKICPADRPSLSFCKTTYGFCQWYCEEGLYSWSESIFTRADQKHGKKREDGYKLQSPDLPWCLVSTIRASPFLRSESRSLFLEASQGARTDDSDSSFISQKYRLVLVSSTYSPWRAWGRLTMAHRLYHVAICTYWKYGFLRMFATQLIREPSTFQKTMQNAFLLQVWRCQLWNFGNVK